MASSSHHNLEGSLDEIFDQTFDQYFDQIFDQTFDSLCNVYGDQEMKGGQEKNDKKKMIFYRMKP